MKKRVFSGALITAYIVVMVLCRATPIFEIMIALLAVTAVYEIHKAAQIKNIPLTVVSLVVSAMIPLTYMGYDIGGKFGDVLLSFRSNAAVCMIIYIIAALILMLIKYNSTRFEHAAISVFSSICVPYSFSVLMLLSDIDKLPGYSLKSEGLYFIIFSFTCSWLTDVFAYLVGRSLGKHKLCPNISPKKTVEGAIGGIVLTMVVNIILLLVFNKFVFEKAAFSYLLIAVSSVILSIISMCGDLSASTIKRNYGIKDFGKILPGHGGIMDRFDSCLFVWPCLYAILKIASCFMGA